MARLETQRQSQQGRRGRWRWALAAIVAVGLALRVCGAWWGYPYALHPDEGKIVEAAWGGPFSRAFATADMAYGDLPRMVLSGVLWAGRVCGLGNSGAKAPGWAYVAARTVNAVLGAATVAVIGYVGAEAAGAVAGLVAAGVLAAAFLGVRECHFATPDAPLTFFAWLAVLASVAAGQSRKTAYFWLAGLAVGAAAACKVTGILAALPALGAVVWAGGGQRSLGRLAAVAAGTAAAFAITNFREVAHPLDFYLAVSGERCHLAGAWASPATSAAYYFAEMRPVAGVGWAIEAVAFVGWFLARRPCGPMDQCGVRRCQTVSGPKRATGR